MKYTLYLQDASWNQFLALRKGATYTTDSTKEELIELLDRHYPPIIRQGEVRKGYKVVFHRG